MAITVTPAAEGHVLKSGDGAMAMLEYIVRGTVTMVDAQAALGAGSPTTYDGLIRKSYEVYSTYAQTDLAASTGVWKGVVRYGLVQWAPATGASKYTFDTGGGTEHIQTSLETVGAYGLRPGGAAVSVNDYDGAIGWDGETARGTDVPVKVYNWGETHYLANAYITQRYIDRLYNLSGTVNNSMFRTRLPGVVLFVGASGGGRSQTDWEITFKFSARPNRNDLTIGGIPNISKRGWEYAWVRSGGTALVSNDLTPNFTSVYVERVMEYGNFALLGIGTS